MPINKNIFLIGLSGSGKSAVGRILAGKLKRTFVDTDNMIEKKTRKSITRIFEEAGEPAFRKLETAALRIVSQKNRCPQVIALGGGAFQSAANRKIVSNSGISIWLRCPINELCYRLRNKSDRPLLKGINLRRLLSAQLRKRLKNYCQADIHISTAKKMPGQVSGEITKLLKKHYAAN